MSDNNNRGVLLVGLGRFGTALGEALVELGHDVLAIDSNEALVQRNASKLSHVIQGDATDPELLSQIGAADFEFAVVAIGTELEASILTTAALADLHIGTIWAKATSDAHRRILERVGAHHVVMPEQEMGARVAHLVTGSMLNYLVVGEQFTIVETTSPSMLQGLSLGESQVRNRYGVTVVAWKRKGGNYSYATSETAVSGGDVLLVAGPPENVEKFAALTS
ncbi:MAG: trk system potassium uptake protein TrkA [Candidatus Poriferisodalaceae bacterium]|jgi:trk system potassium uptake protein